MISSRLKQIVGISSSAVNQILVTFVNILWLRWTSQLTLHYSLHFKGREDAVMISVLQEATLHVLCVGLLINNPPYAIDRLKM